MVQSTGNTTVRGDEFGDVPATERHRILSSEYRRTVLTVLSERQAPTTLDALVSSVDDRLDSGNVGYGSEEDLRLLLHHVHLPMLASADLVGYDHERQRVEP